MRLLVSLALASLLCLPTFANSSIDRLRASVRPLMANILNEFAPEVGEKAIICTATSINARLGLWVTANHCLGHGPVLIEDQATTIVYANADTDVAVLHTPTLQNVPGLRMAVEPLVEDQPVHMLGFPLGFASPQHVHGTVASLDTHVLAGGMDYGHKTMFDMAVCGGNSGSVVVNARDEVVSIIQIGPGNPCAPISGGATWEAMQALAKYFGT